MTAPASRPRAVTAAFWVWLVASVLLMFGGLQASTSGEVPTIARGAGVVFILAGGAVGFLAGRVRTPDQRWWRAGLALSLTLIVIVSLAILLIPVSVFIVIALVPLIIGTLLITRPPAREFHGA